MVTLQLYYDQRKNESMLNFYKIWKLQKGGFLEISKILSPVIGQRVINNAFEKNAKRKRAAIDSSIIKTSAKTGVLSKTGAISNPRHNFHC